MAVLHPFRAWRPKSENIYEIACVPYDVIDTEEAKELAKGKPNSFLHVIRPEIDLAQTIDIHDELVYQKGKENLTFCLQSGLMTQDETPSIYVYRLLMNGRNQTGIFACVSVDDYDSNVILKHELTRPDKEDDRTKHILTQSAHAEPVMLTFKNHEAIQSAIDSIQKTEPLFNFLADDGVQHSLWKLDQTEQMVQWFEEIPHLYVADGHHRCKSASRVAEVLRKSETLSSTNEFEYFPAVLFPMSSMQIMPYNRVLTEVPATFFEQLKSICEKANYNSASPKQKGDFSVFYQGEWTTWKLPETNKNAVADRLDVARLSEFLLEPVCDIKDQRTDKRIHFVGGIRGTVELEKWVNSGKASVAFSLFATSIQELMDVSDAGELMPPKSTWFEPKLRSGLLVHTF